jgi:hypothetical protein
MSLTDKIVQIAKSYVGQEEIPENAGFKNPSFEAKMKAVGWYKGAPWCAFLAKLIWTEAFALADTSASALIRKYSNGSATDTYHNYAASKEFHVQQTPVVGAVVIWKEGNGPSGHAGVVTRVIDEHTIETVEGNTNTNGSREGYIAAVKIRKIGQPFNPHGLNLVGFIVPTRIA